MFGTNTELPEPGHVMLTDASRGNHSSFAPRNLELPKESRLPNFSVGTLKAFPQAERDVGVFYTQGKHFELADDPYVYQQGAGVDAVSGTLAMTRTPKVQHFAFSFDTRFLDPVAFGAELASHQLKELYLPEEAAYQVATVSDNPLDNPHAGPAQPDTPSLRARLEAQAKNVADRGTNQAQNCVTDLLWQLYNTPVPAVNGAPQRTVLTTEDLFALGMEPGPDGGPPRFVPGRDLRPQDLFLYLRFAEAKYLASLEGG
jgi:hypothetical protein